MKRNSTLKADFISVLPKTLASPWLPSQWLCVFSVLEVLCLGVLNFLSLFSFHPSYSNYAQVTSSTADPVHYHPRPKSKLSAIVTSSFPRKSTCPPYYLPISNWDSSVDLTTLSYIIAAQLLALYYKYPHLKFSTQARKLG